MTDPTAARARRTRGNAKPYERLPKESAAAYGAFSVYRDLGPQRSVRKTADQLTRGLRQLQEWSSRNEWVRRAGEWDSDQDRLFIEEMQAERRRVARAHVRIAGAMLAKAVERLQSLDPANMSARDLAYFVDIATKIERQAVGEPVHLEHSGPGGGPLQIERSLPDDELEILAELAAIAEVLQERLGGEN